MARIPNNELDRLKNEVALVRLVVAVYTDAVQFTKL